MIINSSAKDAVDDWRLAIRFIKMTDGMISAPVADTYIENMKKYSKFCIKSKISAWNINILRYFEMVYILENGIINKIQSNNDLKKEIIRDIIRELYLYELIGEILEKLYNEYSWDEIKNYLSKLKLNKYEWELIGENVLEFSEKGTLFMENAFFVQILDVCPNLFEKYIDLKENNVYQIYPKK